MLNASLSAQQLRLLRSMKKLKPRASELDLRVWLGNHIREKEDQEFSFIQEKAWAPYMPGAGGQNSQTAMQFAGVHGAGGGSPARQHSQLTFPGEYRADRDDVQSISVQNLKTMYTHSAKRSHLFTGKHDFLLKIPTLDYEKLEELVANLFPNMERDETNGLLAKVIEAVQLGESSSLDKVKKNYSLLTSDMLQLQGYPQTFSAALEAVARRQESKPFKVFNAREKFFTDLNFKWSHIQQMRRNVQMMGQRSMEDAPDVVDIVHEIYKEYIDWLENNEEKNPQRAKKVPIQEQEINDPDDLQYSYATGFNRSAEALVRIRENTEGAGKMSINGSIPIVQLKNIYAVELVLQPFDEADLNVFNFDVDIEVWNGTPTAQALACRISLSNAIVKMLPHTRPFLYTAGFTFQNQHHVQKTREIKFTGQRGPGRTYKWFKRGNPNKLLPASSRSNRM
eukprot:TRINITY_DN8961_c0_g1_i1.p1 TRINITY_DN8961_c0_g1~~TRINITY_DN8961_c0_g1_i1.p1  ORF type:complete len:452 (+),score=77.53 TRINITY_DN8961_c0_g1_i1:35-1390(+)